MEDFVLRVLEADNPWLIKSDLGEWYHRFLPENYLPRDTYSATLAGPSCLPCCRAKTGGKINAYMEIFI